MKMGRELTPLVMLEFLALAGLSIGSVSGFPIDKNDATNANASVTAQSRNKTMEVVPFEGTVEKLMPYFDKMPGLNSSDDGTLQIQVSLVNSSRSGAASNFTNRGIPLYTIDFRRDPYNHTLILNPSSVNFNVSSFLQEFPLDPMEIKYAVINVTLCSAEGKKILRKVMGKKRYVEAKGSHSGDHFLVFKKKPKKLRDDDYFLRFLLTLVFYGFYICLFGFVVRQNWWAGV